MSRIKIGLLVGLGVMATIGAGIFSQGGTTPPDVALVEEVAEIPAEPEVVEPVVVEAEPEPVVAETMPWVVHAPLAEPELSVVRAGVGLYEADADDESEPREIVEAEQAPVPTGGRVIVPTRGMAVLDWGGALRSELLRAASITVGESDLAQRRVVVDQDAGTVRYLMSMPGEDGPVGMRVAAGPITVDSDTSAGDMADIMITHVPDPVAEDGAESDDGRTWVVVIAGAADIDFGGPVAAAGEAAGERSVRLEAGQGAAFDRGGAAPTVMPMDVVAVETWYGQMLSGYRDSIAAFAFRCVITADEVALRDTPPTSGRIQTSANPAAPRAATLLSGALINITHRTEDARWLEVDSPDSEEPGWIEATNVQCIAPLSAVPIIDQAYLAPATPTPIAVSASFGLAEGEIDSGKCTMLRWDVPVGSQISVDGKLMPGKGFQSVCPDVTTSYTLRWIDASGAAKERRVTVVVNEVVAQVAQAEADAAGDSGSSGGLGGLLDPDSPEPEPTICVGDECEVVLPTAQPTRTRRPRPTKEPTDPPAAPEPTDPPAGPAPTEPPAGPQPTSPPATNPPATATLGATATITVTAPVTSTATATSTATLTPEGPPAPTETPLPTEPPATATLEAPTATPEPEPTAIPEPVPTATPLSGAEAGVR